ncbi:MAG: hypothetical protein DDT21_02420 [Syntrophomonadaceae bacterium]|nr:hypothetical protein [Bacillota bacterium]
MRCGSVAAVADRQVWGLLFLAAAAGLAWALSTGQLHGLMSAAQAAFRNPPPSPRSRYATTSPPVAGGGNAELLH